MTALARDYNLFDELYDRLGSPERPATRLLDGLRNLSGEELEFVFDAADSPGHAQAQGGAEPLELERTVGDGLLVKAA